MHSLLRLSTDNPQANCASGLHFLLSNYTSENNYKKKKKTLNLFLSQLCATDPRDPDPCLTSHDLSHMFACAYRSFFSCSYKFPLCKKKINLRKSVSLRLCQTVGCMLHVALLRPTSGASGVLRRRVFGVPSVTVLFGFFFFSQTRCASSRKICRII